MVIRQASHNDLDEILKLFTETVTHVCAHDYNTAQIKAWASSSSKKQKWLDRITSQFFVIAELDAKIVGFGSLEHGDYIDLLYVHKDYQRQGIASRVLTKLEKESDRQKKNSISADVSITAKPFFEKQGFKIIQEQKKEIDRVEVINFKMVKAKKQLNIKG